MSAVWIITDGKPGHYNQSLGLAMAIQELYPQLSIETLPVLPKSQLLKMAIGFPLPSQIRTVKLNAPPKLIIAAGHATHLSLVILGWRLKAKTLLMMKPTLPICWFDLCLIPAHDEPSVSHHIIETQGALNPMRPAAKQRNTGLILIGGPSKHHGWDESELFKQLETLIASESRDWTVTSSRRTPESTMAKLAELNSVTLIPYTKTPQGWLAEKLAVTEVAWVTEDSVSMVYEALTAGCRVGVLQVPEIQKGSRSRLSRGLDMLLEKKWILYGVHSQVELTSHTQGFNEAQRCAQEISNRGWV